jgi:hypothetical protein
MSDLTDCQGMERLYRDRAKADPKNSTKWLGQAERWRELGKHENAWRQQPRQARGQMHAGPMQMGPNTISGDSRFKQQG